MTTTTTTRRRLARALAWLALLLSGPALGVGALAPADAEAAAPAGTYGWPVRPFFRQHPVRGVFGDPRIGMTPKGMVRSFHFGIDVSCANGTAVYATLDGTVYLESFRPETVSVRGLDGRTEFQYWHIEPAVGSGQKVVAYETVVGHVLAPWAHVHFAEMRDGRYVNPLRPRALGPFRDDTRPRVTGFRVERSGRVLTARTAAGVVDLVVEARDAVPVAVPTPWNGKPVTPALLRWRLVRGGRVVVGWRSAVDVRRTLPANDLYDAVYARWTRQNKRSRPGRYRFYLARALDTARLPAGRYVVQVSATDTRANTGRASFALRVGVAL